MAHIIIDRRKNGKGKSSVNRQKLVKKVKTQVRRAVKDLVRDGNIKDLTNDSNKKIKISGKGLKQPHFQHGPGGVTDRIYPGNTDYVQGDRIQRPGSGKGKGNNSSSSNSEEMGEDEFIFQLSQKEFLDLFFEDLELPDLIKKDINKIEDFTWKRSGFACDGNPSRLNIVRSMKISKGRRFALREPKRKKIKELEEQLLVLNEQIEQNKNEGLSIDDLVRHINKITHEISVLKKRMNAIPFIDDKDLRYNRWEKVPVPSTQAVMFCLMDVSGSMGQSEKELAKRFFILLHLFLQRNYERVDVVFIRHHTVAKEVNEEEFFYSKETGGTIVSSALSTMKEIIDQRYSPSDWNIFACQASDGDNWPDDSVYCQDLLKNAILPITQYFAYVELMRGDSSYDSDLWPYYQEINQSHDNFEMRQISNVSEIYPVFRGLFEKRVRAL